MNKAIAWCIGLATIPTFAHAKIDFEGASDAAELHRVRALTARVYQEPEAMADAFAMQVARLPILVGRRSGSRNSKRSI